jgi:adenosylmethionine-8-amino-7-oxononanoate aminotransferase
LELAGSQRAGMAGECNVETVYQRYKRQLLDPHNYADHSFTLLQDLHGSLQRHPDLKKVFWKASGSCCYDTDIQWCTYYNQCAGSFTSKFRLILMK